MYLMTNLTSESKEVSYIHYITPFVLQERFLSYKRQLDLPQASLIEPSRIKVLCFSYEVNSSVNVENNS